MRTFNKTGLRPMPKDIAHIPLYKMIWKEVYWKNSNFILINSGKPGKGKSWISLVIGYAFDRMVNGGHRFGFKTHVAPTADYFIQLINDENQPKGTVRILDESSIMSGANSREFNSFENKLMSSLTQIMRHRNQLIIFNSPNKGYIDRQVRDLAHAQIHAVDHDNLFNYCKFVFLKDNMFNDNIHTVYPRYINSKGEIVIADELMLYKPPKALTDEYDAAMDKIKRGWEEEYKNQYTTLKEGIEEEAKMSMKEKINIITGNLADYYNENKNKVDEALIELNFAEENIPISVRDRNLIARALNLKIKRGDIQRPQL